MDDKKPVAELKRLLETLSRETVCNKFGISEQYLCDILKGRRPISERVGHLLGFTRTWKERK